MSDDGALDRLERKLNSPLAPEEPKRTEFRMRGMDAPRKWEVKPETEMKKRIKGMKPLELVFMGSAVFFVGAILIAVALFFGGNNTVSSKNVDIRITAPSEIGAGSTLSLQVAVTNKNAVPMELTDLIVEFPPGTRSALDVSTELPRLRESLGTLEPGKSINRTVRAVLFGLQGHDLPVKVSVEYRVPSSNAVFFSEESHTVRINESPATISIDALTEAVSGQKTSFTISVKSNSPEMLKGMLLEAAYPPGFSFDSSSPAPLAGQDIWDLGDIEPGGERKVTVSGTFTGEEGESRVMHLSAGTKKSEGENVIAAPLAMSDLSLTVTKPFVTVELALNGNRSAVQAISRGQAVNGSIQWVNNLPVRIQSLTITLSLKGQILNRVEVRSPRGFYNSNTSSIVWDRSSNPLLSDIAPGESGIEEFSFAALPTSAGQFSNPEIDLAVTVMANRLSEENVPESLQTSAAAKALVSSDVGFRDSIAVLNGPNPPKVASQTTYVATWDISNPGNAIANASVSAILPSYATYVGGAQGISYNASDRLVTWNIGDMPSATSRSVSFQVSFTPSISQVGTGPSILEEQTFTATDRFARVDINRSQDSLRTSDAPGTGNVVP